MQMMCQIANKPNLSQQGPFYWAYNDEKQIEIINWMALKIKYHEYFTGTVIFSKILTNSSLKEMFACIFFVQVISYRSKYWALF